MAKATWDRLFALPQFWIAWHFDAQMSDDDGNDYPDFTRHYPRSKRLELPLPARYRLTIDFANDATVAIEHPRLQEPVELGVKWGCFHFPILRWQEVALVQRRLRQRWTGIFDWKYLPLLLDGLAAFTANDNRRSLSRKYWADWRRTGVISDDQLDANMTFNVSVGKTVNPVDGLEWRYDARCGWVVEGSVESLRDGHRTVEATDEDLVYFEEIRRFFRAVKAGWDEKGTTAKRRRSRADR
jgi:hypothetical protein